MPTYNQANYLPISLDAAWFQDYPNIEIVLVNDGSSDGTEEAIEAYLESIRSDEVSYAADFDEKAQKVNRVYHPRFVQKGRELKVIHHEKNKGLGAALNTGFRACTGEYCTYIASDDILLPNMAATLVKSIEEHDADMAYADMHVINDIGRILRRFSLPSYSFEETFCHWYFCGVCKLYKRSLHEELGWYREDLLSHDHELYLRFAMNGKQLVHVPQVLAHIRAHGPERQVHNHTPQQWSRLFQESSELVTEARRYLATMKA